MAGGAACELCVAEGGVPVARGARWRVVRVADTDFPAFYRVVWNAHVAEFSDLVPDDLTLCMGAVVAVERVLREQLRPAKINLASLGNVVPHLHWHVIARFDWDSRFPQPIWTSAQRRPDPPPTQRLAVGLDALDAAVCGALATLA